MTEREAFERYYEELAPGQTGSDNGVYLWREVRGAWDAWQASRKQALEEAFGLVSGLHATERAPLSTRYLYDSAISAAQDAIRSLTTPTKGKP